MCQILANEHKAREQPHLLGFFCQAEESQKREGIGIKEETEESVSTFSKNKINK